MTEKAAPEMIAENRKAAFKYHLLDTFEAGLVLRGTEVRSIRESGINRGVEVSTTTAKAPRCGKR